MLRQTPCRASLSPVVTVALGLTFQPFLLLPGSAQEGEEKRCWGGSKTGATYFRTKSLTKRAENRTVSHLVAPYRARALAIKAQKLTLYGDAEGSDVATRIKRSQRDRVFTSSEAAEID